IAAAKTTHSFESPFVDGAPSQIEIDECANDRLPQPAQGNMRLELVDPLFDKLLIEPILGGLSQRPRISGIDAGGGLQGGRAVDGQEGPFGSSLSEIAPGVECRDDLLRHVFLHGEERIVGSYWPPILAHLFG